MAEVLTGTAALIMLSALIGLARVLRGPTRADRLLAAQLLSTAGIGALLLLAAHRRGARQGRNEAGTR
ncbi:MAG: hypothetical protein ACKO9A_26025 [Alphaproteobacteria bacterium]